MKKLAIVLALVSSGVMAQAVSPSSGSSGSSLPSIGTPGQVLQYPGTSWTSPTWLNAQSSSPGLKQDTNATVTGSILSDGVVSANQLSTQGVFLYPSYLGVNLRTVAPAYGIDLLGTLRVRGMATPASPTVQWVGTSGATPYNYFVVCSDIWGNKSLASSAGTTTTGNATLSSSNYNTISWVPPDGAYSCDVLKTDTAHTLGNFLVPINSTMDTGQATTAYTYPGVTQTGAATFDGKVTFGGGTAVAASYAASSTSVTGASVVAGAVGTVAALTMTGATAGAACYVGLPGAVTNGLVYSCVVTSNTCTIYAGNPSAGALTYLSGIYTCREWQ